MKHFVDIVRRGVSKITADNTSLKNGILYGFEVIDQYSESWYYKDYFNINIESDYNTQTHRFIKKDVDVSDIFIELRAKLMYGLNKVRQNLYTAVQERDLISLTWLTDNFDIYSIMSPGYQSMSFQFTDYILQVFDKDGYFIQPDKDIAFLYNFMNKEMFIILPKTSNEDNTISIIFKPRRISLDNKMSSQITTNIQNGNIVSEITHQYNYDEILRPYLNNKLEIQNIYKISSVDNSDRNVLYQMSNNVLIQRQKAYFKYLNGKYPWAFRGYRGLNTDNSSINIQNLPVNYGGGKFKRTEILDPGFSKQISTNKSVLIKDLVKNISNYSDFQIFTSYSNFIEAINNYISQSRNILDFDIFYLTNDKLVKFIQYCDKPISTISNSTRYYLYVSNVNSKKIKMTADNISLQDNLDIVQYFIKKLETVQYDELYFDTTADSGYSIKTFDEYGKLSNNGKYYEIEYYLNSTKNGLADVEFSDSTEISTTTSITYSANDWKIELDYIKRNYSTLNTNLDEVYIPDGIDENILNMTINSIATIPSGQGILRNDLVDSISSNFFNKNINSSNISLTKDVAYTTEGVSSNDWFKNALYSLKNNNNIAFYMEYARGKGICLYLGDKPDLEEKNSDFITKIDYYEIVSPCSENIFLQESLSINGDNKNIDYGPIAAVIPINDIFEQNIITDSKVFIRGATESAIFSEYIDNIITHTFLAIPDNINDVEKDSFIQEYKILNIGDTDSFDPTSSVIYFEISTTQENAVNYILNNLNIEITYNLNINYRINGNGPYNETRTIVLKNLGIFSVDDNLYVEKNKKFRAIFKYLDLTNNFFKDYLANGISITQNVTILNVLLQGGVIEFKNTSLEGTDIQVKIIKPRIIF